MTIPAMKRSAYPEASSDKIGYQPGSTGIDGALVMVNASATDGNVADLPTATAAKALNGGRRPIGIGSWPSGGGLTTSVDQETGVQVQVHGQAVAVLLANEACEAGEEVGFDPADGGKVKQITPARRGLLVPLAARFAETKASSASDQQVAIRLKEPQSIGDGAVYVRVTAGSSHTNTVAETTLDSYAIPAYRITKAGTRIHVVASGRCSATHATDTLVVKLYWGATAIAATPTLDVADGDIWHIDEWITVRTAGATGTLLASGDATIGASSQAAGAVEVTAVDFTAANTIYVKATWSVADPGNIEAIQQMFVEIKD
ncbi:MAG TPA: hypothetical protein PK472_01225 [Pseudomonadota bacterium]|jgi:hypothetical protein|nr:hypothetical protein [Nitrospira sp.]HMY56841.1 hypothetical protein [Pseudomonadota bacterium]